MESQRPLKLHALAGRLRLPAAWLLEEAKAGRIPCLQVGRGFLFSANAVEDALLKRAAADSRDEACDK